MKELNQYFETLKERGLVISYRELKARFIRENPIKSIRRMMNICEQNNARFTFFIVGISAEENPSFVQEMIDRGHEVACHGFFHNRFDFLTKEEIEIDLTKCQETFWKHFKYEIKGFRAPYLKMSSKVYQVLRELGFTYSSSYMSSDDTSKIEFHGLREYKIYADDWDILIKRNLKSKGLGFEMIKQIQPENTVYLLHPWRVGQKKYIDSLDTLFQQRSDRIFCNTKDLESIPEGIALGGDIGEFSLYEIAKRILKKH